MGSCLCIGHHCYEASTLGTRTALTHYYPVVTCVCHQHQHLHQLQVSLYIQHPECIFGITWRLHRRQSRPPCGATLTGEAGPSSSLQPTHRLGHAPGPLDPPLPYFQLLVGQNYKLQTPTRKPPENICFVNLDPVGNFFFNHVTQKLHIRTTVAAKTIYCRAQRILS